MNAGHTMNLIRDLKILFIDDDPNFSKPIALYLNKQFGYSTKIIGSAEQAYAELERSEFDIILLDYKLADTSGLDVLKWLTEKNIDTPVIMITGYGCEEVAVEAMKLGAYDYANKGHISFDYVPVLIHNTIERHHLRKQQNRNTQTINTLNEAVETAVNRVDKSLSALLKQLTTLRLQTASLEEALGKKAMENALAEVEQEVHSIKETLVLLTSQASLHKQSESDKDTHQLVSKH
ncbi:MAG: response regulator [Ignavibacteriales bacterium]|nr:response regulator [Ignavibacteriales bacterium]